jgi:hypothetical protein
MEPPFPRSYWADPGRLLAGCYPGDPDPGIAEQKLRGLLECGVRTVISLMQETETDHRGRAFEPYAQTLERLARESVAGIACQRHSITDMATPSRRTMHRIQAAIDDSIGAGRPVYVHCWGGRGRTGTVVGAYLIRHGLATAQDFVDVIARLRARDAGGGPSPETPDQVAFVRRYVESL